MEPTSGLEPLTYFYETLANADQNRSDRVSKC